MSCWVAGGDRPLRLPAASKGTIGSSLLSDQYWIRAGSAPLGCSASIAFRWEAGKDTGTPLHDATIARSPLTPIAPEDRAISSAASMGLGHPRGE